VIYVGNMAEGHARVRRDDVEAHLDDTWFAWLGEVNPDGVYCDRVPDRRDIHRP
jgi:hypothetical protein